MHEKYNKKSKMKKEIIEYNGILLDSEEEKYFCYWLDEAISVGWVEKWKYITKPLELYPAVKYSYLKKTQLKTKTKEEHKWFTLLQNLEYTPDFKILWTTKGYKKFVSDITYGINPKSLFFSGMWERDDKQDRRTTFVEIKPKFDFHQKTSRFSIIQKIVWNVKKVFVDLIQLEDLFKETWMPKAIMEDFKYKVVPKKAAAKGKIKGSWKIDYIPKTIEEYESK